MQNVSFELKKYKSFELTIALLDRAARLSNFLATNQVQTQDKLKIICRGWDREEQISIDPAIQLLGCKRGRASSGCFLSKKTKAAAACSQARAERLALRRCQSFSWMARRAARAWASSTVLSSLRLTVWVVCVVSSIGGKEEGRRKKEEGRRKMR